MSAADGARGLSPLALACGIALAVLVVYAPVREHPFVVYDDKGYVTENPLVAGGLTREGVVAAFTTQGQGNYIPLAWLSHMLDVELFGLAAGAHHAVSVSLHLVSTLLLFALLLHTTAAPLPSAFAALVFGIHPLHVESVAWISERRDVLSGLFFVATLAAWTGFARAHRRRAALYALALVLFALGLLAKPMLVTLPCVLLLFDVWPLGRAPLGWRRLALEKLPFLGVAAAASALAVATQGEVRAIASLEQLPLAARLANALISYAAYLGQTVVPVGLAVFYPHPEGVQLWRATGAALLLAALTALALAPARRQPVLAVGWLWFLGMLVPVIGLVQIGSQARADRYTYLPLIGLALAAGFGLPALLGDRPRARRGLAALAGVWLVACGALARAQVETWRSSETLFEHARRVTGDNHVVLVNLAEAHDDAGHIDEALALYAESLALFSGARRVNARMGALYAARGQLEPALRHLQRSIELHPEEPGARLELARLLLRAGRAAEAAALLREELTLAPGSAAARFHLAEATALEQGWRAAVPGFREAFAGGGAWPAEPVLPRSLPVAAAVAAGLVETGRAEEAQPWLTRALALARFAGDEALAQELEAISR